MVIHRVSKLIALCSIFSLAGMSFHCGGGAASSSASASSVAAPVAAFTTVASAVASEGTIQFTDTSANAPTSWSWDFGDGSTSSNQSPSHDYAVAGSYTVVLTATNSAGSSTARKPITARSTVVAPVAAFAASATSVTTGVAIQFTDASTNTPTSWSWSFGDGATSTSKSPSHAYTVGGTYTVTLTATNSAGSSSGSKTITVTAPVVAPVAAFAASATSVTTGVAIQFTDASTNTPTSWSWNFGDGSTITAQDPTHIYLVAGTYTITLTATNGAGSSTTTKSISVTAAVVTPVAAFTASATSVTTGVAIQFTDASTNTPTSWSWNFGDSATSTARNPTHAYSVVGSYTVTLTATNSAGSTQATSQVVVVDDGYLNASTFGFDPAAANNFAAMQAMATYANTQKTIKVRFLPGTYTITLPETSGNGYAAGSLSACPMANVTGVWIDASQATLFVTNDTTRTDNSLFRFDGCSNLDINANFLGAHTGLTGSGVKGLYLKSNNTHAKLTFTAKQMFDGVRIGNWEDPAVAPTPVFEGNQDITVNCTTTDTYYSVAAFLTDTMTITSHAIGTQAGKYGAHRAVYLDGCSNVTATSDTCDLAVGDGVNIIGTAPMAVAPFHAGSSNISLTCNDLGTTHYVASQCLVKMNVVTSSTEDVPTITDNIQMDVHVNPSGTVWTANRVFAAGSVSVDQLPHHRFTNISLSGTVDRDASYVATMSPTIHVENITVGMLSFDLTLKNFHDLYTPAATKPISIYVGSAQPAVTINAYSSDIGSVTFTDTSKQSCTSH